MKRIDTQHGLTLIELLIAVAILLIGLIPLLSLFLQAMTMTEQSNKRTIATNLARDLQEEIRSKAFSEPDPPALVGTLYYPNGTTAMPFGLEESTFGTSDSRVVKFDDVDDYNGWCRGQDCTACVDTQSTNGLCKDNSPMEAYNGEKYEGNAYVHYRGFTRRVEIFNIFPNVSTAVASGESREGDEPRRHRMEIGMPDTSGTRPSYPFLFYDLRENTLATLSNNPQKGSAQGKSRLKIIRVTVSYTGPATPDVRVEDVGLAVLPVSQ